MTGFVIVTYVEKDELITRKNYPVESGLKSEIVKKTKVEPCIAPTINQ